jgi:hypothetical protein
MQDVAVAEASASKGEIVVSPQAHRLLHGNYDDNDDGAEGNGMIVDKSNSNGAFGERVVVESNGTAGGSRIGSGSGSATHSMHSGNHTSHNPLTCGCRRTRSGYFRLQTGLDAMTCQVEFSSAAEKSRMQEDLMQQENLQKEQADAEKGLLSCAPMLPIARGPKGSVEGTATDENATSSVSAEISYQFEVYTLVVEELMAGYKYIGGALAKKLENSLVAVLEEMEQEGFIFFIFYFLNSFIYLMSIFFYLYSAI